MRIFLQSVLDYERFLFELYLKEFLLVYSDLSC